MLSLQNAQARFESYSKMLAACLAPLLLIVVGGCDAFSVLDDGNSAPEFSTKVAHETLGAGAVNVEQIDRGQYGDVVEGIQTVLRDEDEYAAFWERLHADQKSVPERPSVDFDKQVVVAIVLGQRSSGGYGVKIDEVLANPSGKKLQVRYTKTTPGEGCAVTTVLTSPYVLATVETQGGDFRFSGSETTHTCK